MTLIPIMCSISTFFGGSVLQPLLVSFLSVSVDFHFDKFHSAKEDNILFDFAVFTAYSVKIYYYVLFIHFIPLFFTFLFPYKQYVFWE